MIDNLKDKVCQWLLGEAASPLLVVDAAGAIVLSNPAAQALFGYPEEELGGLTVESLIPERYGKKHRQDHVDYVRDPQKRPMNDGRALPARRRDGSEFVAEINLNPLDNGLVLATIKDVTERKQAAEALRESEERLQLFIEHAPAALAMFDRDMRYLAASRRWMEDYAPADRDIIGRSHYEIFPDIPEHWKAAHQRSLAGEVVEVDEDRFARLDGSVQWVRWAVRPWHTGDGAVGGIVIFAEDITERKHMQAAMAARAQEFRSLAESSPDAIMRYDREGRILYLNQKLYCDLGVTAAEVIGKTTGEVWPDNRFADVARAVMRTIRTGEAATVELGHPVSTGEWIFSEIRVIAERDDTGRTVGALAFGRNVTAIREAERRLTHFIENLPGMAYVARLSPDGLFRFPFVSSGIVEIYGLRPEDVMDDRARLHNLTHPDDRPRLDAAIAESARTLKPFRVEFRICPPGQPERWVAVRSVPTREADGTIVWYGITLDISERKRSEAALQAMRAEMEQAMRFHVASQTVAALAHELNQPLNAVSSYAEAALRLLSAGNTQPDKLHHALERSAEQAQRAGQVVRELLTFMNQGEVQVEPVDLNDSARRVLKRAKADYPDAFEGRLEIEPGLPRVSVNRLQVEKVLANLIENGLDALRDGGVEERLIAITLRSRSEGPVAQVTVRDSGPGIDAQTLHRIFDPFFTTKPKGLGMGLAISRAIIEANGGQLWVESEPGSGTSFHLTLPFAS
jgi:two-component system sensor kinase FixL